MDNLIITSMFVYLVLSFIIPRVPLFKQSTNVSLIDNLILYLYSQKGFLMYGVIFTGFVVYIAINIESRVTQLQ